MEAGRSLAYHVMRRKEGTGIEQGRLLADGFWRWDDDALGKRPRADARGTRPTAADLPRYLIFDN